MTSLMYALVWATFGLTFAAVAASVVSIFRPRAVRYGRWLTLAAAVASVLGFAVRWKVSGHPAIFGTHENTLALATSLLVSAALLAVKSKGRWREIWRWATPWALAALFYGSFFRSAAIPLTISERSLWVEVHVTFAWMALLPFLAATTASILRLVGKRPLQMEDAETDRFITECLLGGFCGFTAMLATGAWYSFILFGEVWQWSVVETFSLTTWLSYALVIHGRLFYRWGGRRLDIGVILVLPVTILAYFIWSVFPGTWHFFDVPLVKPY